MGPLPADVRAGRPNGDSAASLPLVRFARQAVSSQLGIWLDFPASRLTQPLLRSTFSWLQVHSIEAVRLLVSRSLSPKGV